MYQKTSPMNRMVWALPKRIEQVNNLSAHKSLVNRPRPMTSHAAFKTSARVSGVFCLPSTAGHFNSNFVSHEIAFMILSDTFFSSLLTIEFLQKDETSIRIWRRKDTHHKAIAEPEYPSEHLRQLSRERKAIHTDFSSILTMSPIFPKQL